MNTISSVSVVICSLNGEKRISATLESLRRQNYSSSFEIIVVDDGSTDDTGVVAKNHGARVIRHEQNRGRAASRNTGWRNAAGEVVVFIDDDCIAEVDWLEQLASGFTSHRAGAVAGQVVPYKTNRFSERFMAAVGYGNPALLETGRGKGPLRRLLTYCKNMLHPMSEVTHSIEVNAVYTANAAYRVAALHQIGGFDETLRTDEDTDVSARLRMAGEKLFYVPSARVSHRHYERMRHFVRENYIRAENTLRYYTKEKKIPPLFPFPILYVCLGLSLSLVDPLACVVWLVFGPNLLYYWWPIRALRRRRLEYFVYSYIQLLLESASLLGLYRGWRLAGKRALPVARHTIRFTSVSVMTASLFYLALLNIAILCRHVVSPLITTPLIFFGLIALPGALLALVLKLKPKLRVEWMAYSFGLALSFWIIGGFVLNWFLPLVGVAQPLRLVPLMAFFDISIFALSIIGCWRWADRAWKLQRTAFNASEKFFSIYAPLVVVLSVAGSRILNNDGNSTVTLAMVASVAVYVFLLSLNRRPIRDGVYAWGLYCLALALLLMYSMRSWHLMGWDVHAEYQVFQLAVQHGHWSMSYFRGQAYNACLSITILPAILSSLLPIGPEYIFKLVMELLFATMPVLVFLLARRYIFSMGAALAGFTFMSQLWFYEQMPALIRQEVALLFFALALLAIFDASLKRWQQVSLFMVASCSLIMSHYSTAYIWLIMLLLTLIFSYILRLFIPSLRTKRRLLTWPLLFASIACILCWEGIITQTGGAFATFTKNTATHISQAFTPNVLEDGATQVLFAGPSNNTNANLQKYYKQTTKEYREKHASLYPVSTYKGYAPRIIDYQLMEPSLVPNMVSRIVLLFSKLSKLLIINVFTLLGTAIMVIRIRKKRLSAHSEYIALCLAAFPLIVAIIFLPIFQVNYNITRLFMQTFIVLSLATVVGGLEVFRFVGRWRVMCTALLLIVFFLYAIGFTERFVGGPARVTLNQPNGTFDTYYTYDGEVAAADWLARIRQPGVNVYADSLASLRLRSYSLFDADSNDIFPSTITKNSYVFMSTMNISRGTAYIDEGNSVVSYTFPTSFLDHNKDEIYNNGYAKVYR